MYWRAEWRAMQIVRWRLVDKYEQAFGFRATIERPARYSTIYRLMAQRAKIGAEISVPLTAALEHSKKKAVRLFKEQTLTPLIEALAAAQRMPRAEQVKPDEIGPVIFAKGEKLPTE